MQTLLKSDIFEMVKAAFMSEVDLESIDCFVETEDHQNWLVIGLENERGVRFPRIKILMRHARNKKLLKMKLLNIRGSLEDIGYKFKPSVL